jgi:hypothetical protein
MGVLEDAIRDHLALKRRHGARDEELRRQEAEALGAARREGAEAPEEVEQAQEGPVDEASAVEPTAVEPTPVEEGEPEPAAAEPAAAEPAPPLDEPFLDEQEGAPVDAVDQDTVIYTPPGVEPEPGPEPAPEQEGFELEIGPEPTAAPGPEEGGEPAGDALPPVTEDGDPVEYDAPPEEARPEPAPEQEQDSLRVERKSPPDLDFE